MATKREQNETVVAILAVAVVAWLVFHKKKRGSVEIGPLDQGEFLPDNYQDTDAQTSGNRGSYPTFIGPLPITYSSGSDYQQLPQISGMRRLRGNIVQC